MKKTIQILAALFVTMVIQAQEKRNPGHFTGLNVTGSLDVTLIKGAEGVTVSASKEVTDHLKTAVKNDILYIYMEGKYKAKGEVHIEVSFNTMRQIILNGSGDIVTKDHIDTPNLQVELVGSGDITINVRAENVKASLNGSGDLKLEGKASNFEADLIGSGDLEAIRLESENVKVNVSGSGDASVYASKAIMARVEGSGDIKYGGNPAAEDTKVSGSGSIEKK
ncbi:head GIN domain-containing protein [Flavobacterium sp.]|uniref:head GIN domain-containing protein n=1 Tax=Flavobacterium sp. TaxID=239 RepID=UPI00263015D5|nr:head GIN domain-containing protein [Flavobacterium sp.]